MTQSKGLPQACDHGTGHFTQMDTWELPNKDEGPVVKQKVVKMKF